MTKVKLIELRVLECVKDPIVFIEQANTHGITFVGCYDSNGTFCKDLTVKPSEEAPAPDGFLAFDIYKQAGDQTVLLADLVFNLVHGTYVIEKFAYGMTHLKLTFEVEYSPK